MHRWTPKPKEMWLRALPRSMMRSSGRSKTRSSRLPEAYHMTTLSPLRMNWPLRTVSFLATRRM